MSTDTYSGEAIAVVLLFAVFPANLGHQLGLLGFERSVLVVLGSIAVTSAFIAGELIEK